MRTRAALASSASGCSYIRSRDRYHRQPHPRRGTAATASSCQHRTHEQHRDRPARYAAHHHRIELADAEATSRWPDGGALSRPTRPGLEPGVHGDPAIGDLDRVAAADTARPAHLAHLEVAQRAQTMEVVGQLDDAVDDRVLRLEHGLRTRAAEQHDRAVEARRERLDPRPMRSSRLRGAIWICEPSRQHCSHRESRSFISHVRDRRLEIVIVSSSRSAMRRIRSNARLAIDHGATQPFSRDRASRASCAPTARENV